MKQEEPHHQRRDFSRGEQHGKTRRAKGDRGGYFQRHEQPAISPLDALQELQPLPSTSRKDAVVYLAAKGHPITTERGAYDFFAELGFRKKEIRAINAVYGFEAVPMVAEMYIAPKHGFSTQELHEAFAKHCLDLYEGQDAFMTDTPVVLPYSETDVRRRSLDELFGFAGMRELDPDVDESLPTGFESSTLLESLYDLALEQPSTQELLSK